jgi:hypothetical protein
MVQITVRVLDETFLAAAITSLLGIALAMGLRRRRVAQLMGKE